MRQKLLWGFFILSIAAVLACYTATRLVPSHPVPPPEAAALTLPALEPVPDFRLTDQQGQPFGRQSLAGRVWIADFIFTSCAGACPVMTQKMVALQNRLPAEIQLVSFTVDPARDTPPVLAEYGRRYAAREGRWHFLTGPAATIAELVQKGFRLAYAEDGGPEEPITHSQRFVLVDAAGVVRGYYDSTEPAALRKLESDARTLLAKSRP